LFCGRSVVPSSSSFANVGASARDNASSTPMTGRGTRMSASIRVSHSTLLIVCAPAKRDHLVRPALDRGPYTAC
jgi:hypothetical protein